MKLEVESDDCIYQAVDPNEPEREGCTYFEYEGELDWRSPTPTSVLRLVGDVPIWVETASLEELKTAKNLEINLAKYAADQTSFTFANKEIQADPASMLQIQSVNGIILLTGSVPVVAQSWKTLNNEYVSLPDVSTWTQFYVAMVTKGSSNHVHAQTLKARLLAATTTEEVGAITWNS